MRPHIMLWIGVIALLFSGCSSSNTVGSDELVDIADEGNADRVGVVEQFEEPDPTPSPEPSSEPAVVTTPSPETTAEPTEEPAEAATPEYEPVEIAITVDGFDPLHQRVWVGTEVRFVNHDSVERHVTGLDDGFDSGPIPPGGVVVYTAAEVGEFNFQDETRVYYVVRIEVLQP